MPRRLGTRPLKRWRYVGAYGPELMLCVGDARVGPVPQRFWAVAFPDGTIRDRTTIGRGGVRIDGSRVRVASSGVVIDLTVDEDGGVATTHPNGDGGYVWTRKQAGIRARGTVRVDGREYGIDCEGAIDDTAGYHERHTAWKWSTGVGRDRDGRRIGWNLVSGVNDGDTGSERAIWVDGEPFEPDPVTFADDLSSIAFGSGEALRFPEWASREDDTNVLVMRSSYRQPFGTFTGALPGGIEVAQGFGVMESHDVRW